MNKKNFFPWLLIILGANFFIYAIIKILPPSILGKLWDNENYQGAEKMASYVYGITAPLIGLTTIIFVYLTYSVQKKQLDETTKSLQKQRFEDNFFKLLENHHRIVEAMSIKNEGGLKQNRAEKRECFKLIFDENFDDQVKTYKKDDNQNKITKEEIAKIYDISQNQYNYLLHNYFRFIYHILKFVKSAEGMDNKMQYTNILRATLSPYEIVLLFYNGLHKHGIDLLPLMEEFSFLKNIDDNLLFHIEQKKGYQKLAFASRDIRLLELQKWEKHRLTKQLEEENKKTLIANTVN